jgi:hypothetical protein
VNVNVDSVITQSQLTETASPTEIENTDTTTENNNTTIENLPKPNEADITNVDYITLHEKTYKDFEGEWVRIAGIASNIHENDNAISFRENLSTTLLGATDNVYVTGIDFSAFNVNKGDYVTIVGIVKPLKVLGQISIDNAFIEDVGENSKILHEELIKQARQAILDSAIKISAVDLAREYEENEVRANNNYKGKLLLVTGTVESIDSGIFNSVSITLNDGNRYSFSHPMFSFREQAEKDKVAQLNIGDYVTILGTASKSSVLGRAMIDDCIFICR